MFQSTHSRGVRQCCFGTRLQIFLFQSTHSRGVRHLTTADFPPIRFVSIHALTRSATQILRQFSPYFNCFNPRTHEECDFRFGVICYPVNCFNPRTHEECDNEFDIPNLLLEVSIHALTRSATIAWFWAKYQEQVSIHALTRSATVYIFSLLFSDI